jgi:hypothetical protein
MCTARPGIVIKQSNGGDWTSIACDNGHKLTGGGCDAVGSPYKFQYNGPNGNNGWMCGGHGGEKTVFVICSAL